MDNNKLEKLRQIDYTIHKSCGLCCYSSFSSPNNNWGICRIHKYDHLKHTEKFRELSVNKYGNCSHFSMHHQYSTDLDKFREFIE